MGRVQEHNKEIRTSAESRAREMQTWPSPLEEKMQVFLDKHGIYYEFQKVFYITDDNGWITRYYIADFYLPQKKVIIEVDGKFHDKHKQHDRDRTRTIQEYYHGIEVLRYKWKDMSDKEVLSDLLHRVA